MRKLIAAILVAGATVAAAPVMAADMPEYPPIIEIPDLPPVDYGLAGAFYLRGSVAANIETASDYTPGCPFPCAAGPADTTITDFGYGYSVGAGLGYEAGDGLRADVTLDYLQNAGMTDGDYDFEMRAGFALANVYYDFSFDDYGSAMGGFGAYVGAGLGGAYYETEVDGPVATPDGYSVSPAAAVMTGVTYDMGAVVADLGYRGIYLPELTNSLEGPSTSFYLYNNMIHELRGTVRYRFN